MSKIKERRVWYFECERCGKARRQSHKKQRAKEATCRSCRRSTPNPNQATLFGFKVKTDESLKEGEVKIVYEQTDQNTGETNS